MTIPFEITLKPSISLGLLVALLYGMATFITWIVPVALIYKALIYSGILISFYRSWRYALCRLPASLITLEKRSNGEWWGKTKAGEYYHLLLCSDTVVTTKVICLQFRTLEQKQLCSLIFSWEHEKKRYRQLSRILRIQK